MYINCILVILKKDLLLVIDAQWASPTQSRVINAIACNVVTPIMNKIINYIACAFNRCICLHNLISSSMF